MELHKYLIFFLLATVTVLYSCSTSADTSTPPPDGEPEDTTFYINNQQDFDKYKNKEFSAGSSILFAKGQIFNGQFAPTGSGTPENPIIVTAYDPESGTIYTDNIDEKPIINGQGKVNSVFYLRNEQFWEINNLEITNTDGSDRDQGDLRGIHVVAEDMGVVEHIVIKNCYLHDVNGKVEGKGRGGIHVHVYGEDKPTRFDHVRIVNNVVENVGGVGIGNDTSWPSIYDPQYTPWTDIVFRGNRVERSGRNAIIIRDSKEPIVEYNVVAYSSQFSVGHSIFNFNTIDCIMQYNEVYGNTGAADEADRGAFDADYNSYRTIIQYNYSHDNNWFAGIMRKLNKGVKIRYNISQNELLGAYFYGFPNATELEDVEIYNNTHYFKEGLDVNVFPQTGRNRVPIETTFNNNIFFFADSAQWGNEPAESASFKNNLFYNLAPKGTDYITDNPMFVDPGKGGTDINMKDAARLSGYQLQAESPAIDAGVEIQDNGGKDFWGNSLYHNTPDIGAYEHR